MLHTTNHPRPFDMEKLGNRNIVSCRDVCGHRNWQQLFRCVWNLSIWICFTDFGVSRQSGFDSGFQPDYGAPYFSKPTWTPSVHPTSLIFRFVFGFCSVLLIFIIVVFIIYYFFFFLVLSFLGFGFFFFSNRFDATKYPEKKKMGKNCKFNIIDCQRTCSKYGIIERYKSWRFSFC